MRFRALPLCLPPLCLLAGVSLPAFAAPASIDPDPASPSLSELLAREEAHRPAPSALAPVPDLPLRLTPVADLPAAAPAAAPVPPRSGVRTVYPSPYAQGAVTVLVPGAQVR